MAKHSALVTGAGGAIGAALVRKLIAEGYAVRALVHSTSANRPSFPSDLEIISGDVTDMRLVSESVRKIDFVFHLAAKLHIENPPRALADEYARVNLEGTRCVVKAATT